MTRAPGATRNAVGSVGFPGATARSGGSARRRPRPAVVLAGLAALVAVTCALLMPFAPVAVNEPTVSWPHDPARPESTLLTLTAYRPLALDVRFSCDVARLAQATGDGVVVSTTLPGAVFTGTPGMIVTTVDDRVRVRAFDRILLDEPLPSRACEYRITGRSAGRPSYVRPPPVPGDPVPDLGAFAGPDNARLVVARDGRELVATPAEQLPDVDALVTSLTALPPGAAGDLAVELRVDDEFTSGPTPRKHAITAMLVLALLAVAALLLRIDRAAHRDARRWRLRWPRIVDVAVPSVLVCWALVAPATDDDGYFAAQARNATVSGGVGNYYQLYDQSFTPFTWLYQGLSWWQQLVGLGPVPQRIPALVFGLLTWIVLRRFAAAALDGSTGKGTRAATHAVLGVVFLAWWLPYDMGVRPEPAVALCAAATMLAVLVAGRRRRLAAAWVACALAGAGFTAHTTGVILLAPLLAGLPLLLPLVHVPGARLATALRGLAVASGGMVAPLLGFADGALRDFVRGQAMFLSISGQEGWAAEFQRYAFLLDQGPMGNFAKRSAVLACLVALAWFAVLAVAATARRVALPTPLWLAGSSTALAFAALALTPSKWSHHFGSLAGIGPAFLGLMLVLAVPLTRQVLRGARLPLGVLVAAACSVTAATALAWHGPNSWPYAWLGGVHTPDVLPAVGPVTLDRPLLWGLAVVLVALVLVAVARRRTGEPRLGALLAVPIVLVASLAATSAYAVGTFGLAAAQGVPRESIWARSLAGSECGAAGDIRVLDPFTAAPLPAAGPAPPPPPGGFVAGAGYYADNRPQGSAADRVWGSLVARDGLAAERTVGEIATGWYALPSGAGAADTTGAGTAAVTVLAAGTLGDGNALTAVYGRRTGSSMSPVGAEPLTDTASSPSWRTFVLTPPAGADVVRLDAVDATGAVHGWLAFTAPAAARPVVLQEFLPEPAPVALGWNLAFAYPCQRQPEVVDGVTEPPAYAVAWGEEALGGLTGIGWDPVGGGVFGQVARSQSVLQVATVGPVDPHVQVYAFGTPLARDAYTLTTDRRSTLGGDTTT